MSGSWTIHGKIVYSFEDLNSLAWKPYCEEGSIEDHPIALLSDTESAATRKIFVELLNFTLKDQLFALDLGYSSSGYFFQKPTPTLAQRTATYNSRAKRATRILFSAYQSKDGTTVSFYRHSGFKPQFYRFENSWFLQIVPTYHFTTDGYRVSPLTGAALAGIKRLENNEAVYGQVLMWARLLQQQTNWNARPRRIFFADPLKFSASAGFDDNVWLLQQPPAEDGDIAPVDESFVEASS